MVPFPGWVALGLAHLSLRSLPASNYQLSKKGHGEEGRRDYGFQRFRLPSPGMYAYKRFLILHPIATKPPVTIGDNHYSRGKAIILPPVPLLPKGH